MPHRPPQPSAGFLALVLAGLLAASPAPAQIATFLGVHPTPSNPLTVDAAPDGSYWITDSNNQARKYSAAGALLVSLGDGSGALGTGPGQFAGAQGAVVEPDGNVVIGDTGNARFQVFRSGGQYLTQFSGAWDPHQFATYVLPPEPAGAGEFLYAIYNSTATYFLRADESGTGLGGWLLRPSLGSAFTVRSGVVYVGLDASGNIRKFALDGTPLGTISAGLPGRADALAVMQSGSIIVLDIFNTEIRVYALAANGARLGTIGDVAQFGIAHDLCLASSDSKLYVAGSTGVAVYQLNSAVPTVGTSWGHIKALSR